MPETLPLFGPDLPEGFHYRTDVITTDEERILLEEPAEALRYSITFRTLR